MTTWLTAPYWPNDMGPLNDKTYEWVKDFEIELNESHNPVNHSEPAPKIRGRIGILEKGDTKRAGLALLWRRVTLSNFSVETESDFCLSMNSRNSPPVLIIIFVG